MPSLFDAVLNQPTISRIRRNHGLEHATIHILSKRFPGTPLAGHSDAGGFWLLGDVSSEDVTAAVQQVLQRMQAGERSLAVHPNCGTNFVTTGTLAGLSAALTMFSSGRRTRDKLERLPLAMTVATLALILSQPLGYFLQERVTTSGDPGDMEIAEIIPTYRGRIRAHRVLTQN